MVEKAVRAGPKGGEAPVKPVLQVLLLYEDLGTALRAKHSLDLLPSQLSAVAAWGTRLWRLDLLSEPILAEQSAIEAAAADVIILSLHGRNELRPEVRDWLSRWLDHKEDRPYALAALLDPEPGRRGGKNPVLACLKRVAKAAHADLFCGFCNAPALGRPSRLTGIASRPRALRASARRPSKQAPNDGVSASD
jgi:hypothetical protein